MLRNKINSQKKITKQTSLFILFHKLYLKLFQISPFFNKRQPLKQNKKKINKSIFKYTVLTVIKLLSYHLYLKF